MLTDTEHDGRTTMLLSLLVAAIVLVIAFVKQRLAGRGDRDGTDTAAKDEVAAG